MVEISLPWLAVGFGIAGACGVFVCLVFFMIMESIERRRWNRRQR